MKLTRVGSYRASGFLNDEPAQKFHKWFTEVFKVVGDSKNFVFTLQADGILDIVELDPDECPLTVLIEFYNERIGEQNVTRAN